MERKEQRLTATEVWTIATQGPIPRVHSPNIDAADFHFSPVLTGATCFARPTAGRIGSRFNDGLLAPHENDLLMTKGYIFVGADFVGAAGGVYRSSDYGDRRVEINRTSSKPMFARWRPIRVATFLQRHIFGGGVSRSTDNGDS